MIKKVAMIAVGFLAYPVHAVGPQAGPQVYTLASQNNNQVLMLSNWSQGQVFAEYVDYNKLTGKFFSHGQQVWIRCGDLTTKNRIEKFHTELGTTALILENDPGCQEKPLLMSNYPFPRQNWAITKPSTAEIENIRIKLAKSSKLEVAKITCKQKGVLFLVFDPSIPASYNEGGYRLFDEKLNEISMVEGAPLTPLIDLDGDSVPEFFIPSSDGLDAWIWRLYPKLVRGVAEH